MKIGIIAGSSEGQKTGIGVYTYNLIKSLREVDLGNEYFSISRKHLDTQYADKNHQITYQLPGFIPLEKGGYLFWLLIYVPIRLWLGLPVKLIHDTSNYGCFALLGFPHKKVITIHDIGPIVNRGNFKKITVLIHQIFIPLTIRRANAVITDSEFSKNELIRHLKADQKKITVVYPGIDKQFRVVSELEKESVKARYRLPDIFILFIGSIHKQKNIQALVRAYSKVKNKARCKLVVVGRKMFEGDPELWELIKSLTIEEDIIFTGYVPDEDMPAIYSAASVFVMPSLYEGFGLPPLEAMACGTPVVASNRASLPEAVGDAGLIVDPDDTDALAQAIMNLMTNEKMRSEMIRRGFERVKRFSTEQTALGVLEVYKAVLGKNKAT